MNTSNQTSHNTSVFRGVDRIVKGALQPPDLHKQYVLGVDLAKLHDFTVLVVLDLDGHLVAFDRFSQLDWVFQRKRIVQLAQQYNNARLLIDSSGVGDPVCDELQRKNVQLEGHKFTYASKKDLIENLSMIIENQQVTIPPIPELINELKLFGYKTLASGNFHYGAPEGYHDDTVIALALAAWQIKHNNQKPSSGISIAFPRKQKYYLLHKEQELFDKAIITL